MKKIRGGEWGRFVSDDDGNTRKNTGHRLLRKISYHGRMPE